jgi:hypothetical protein
MALVSISEAARLVRKSRSTLYKTYIETGKLSVGQDSATGRPVVDTSELMRVFGVLYTTHATGHATDTKTHNATHDATPNATPPRDMAIDLLRQLVKSKEDQLAQAKEQLRAAQEREEWMRKQVDEMTGMMRLLQHKKD